MVLTNLREVMLSNEVLQATLDRCGITAVATAGDAPVQGVASDVDRSGALTLTLPDGARHVFVAGEVSLDAQ